MGELAIVTLYVTDYVKITTRGNASARVSNDSRRPTSDLPTR